jgi:signal recognition particle subunit SRP54
MKQLAEKMPGGLPQGIPGLPKEFPGTLPGGMPGLGKPTLPGLGGFPGLPKKK